MPAARRARTAVLSLCILLALASGAAAADTTTAAAASSAATTATTDAASSETSATSTSDATSTTAASDTSATSDTTTATSTTDTATSTDSAATTTAASTGSKATGSTSVYHLSDLPTLAGASIPSVTVPNLSSAPFMSASGYPEGTVFICVAALLGFFGACILAWRALAALSLRRSVKRAVHAQHLAEKKSALRGPGGGAGSRNAYSALYAGSNMSLDQLARSGNGTHTPNTPGTPGLKSPHHLGPSTSTLFFSPTAGAGASVSNANANRSSSHLPSGFYAPRSNSMAFPSPPDSPGFPPQSRDGGVEYKPSSPLGNSPYGYFPAGSSNSPGHGPGGGGSGGVYGEGSGANGRAGGGAGHHGQSTSSLNLSTAPQGRAPSAYLEDLFESHGGGGGDLRF